MFSLLYQRRKCFVRFSAEAGFYVFNSFSEISWLFLSHKGVGLFFNNAGNFIVLVLRHNGVTVFGKVYIRHPDPRSHVDDTFWKPTAWFGCNYSSTSYCPWVLPCSNNSLFMVKTGNKTLTPFYPCIQGFKNILQDNLKLLSLKALQCAIQHAKFRHGSSLIKA